MNPNFYTPGFALPTARPCLYCEHLTESGGCKIGGYSVCRKPSDAADKKAREDFSYHVNAKRLAR